MIIKERINSAISVKQKMLKDSELMSEIQCVSDVIIKALVSKRKVLFCGNGGSAADAQHLAAELSGRFNYDRPPLNAEALHVNSSYLTAVANDYSFDIVYSRLVEAFGKEGDVLVGISTSGNAKNVLNAIEEANKIGMVTVGFTGAKGGLINNVCQHLIKIPSVETPRIQEGHILTGHIVCEIVEQSLYPKS